MTNRLDVSAIADSIKTRIGQIEDQMRQHQILNEELDRLRGALARLEGGVRSRINGGRSGRQPAARARTTAGTAATPKATAARKAAPKAGGSRAPRGENKAKILQSLKTGPKTASEIAKEAGIGTGTVSSTLTKMAKAGEVAKAERGYKIPQ